MAKEKEAKKEPEKAQDLQKTKKKLPIKVIIIVVGVMIMEIATVYIVKMTNKPDEVEGETSPIDQTAVVPAVVESEVVVVEEMAVDNWTTGKTKYIVNFSAVLKVEDGVKEAVTAKVAQHKNEIMAVFRKIVGKAEPAMLKDPRTEVVSQQMRAELELIIGEGMIKDFIIPSWSAMPIE